MNLGSLLPYILTAFTITLFLFVTQDFQFLHGITKANEALFEGSSRFTFVRSSSPKISSSMILAERPLDEVSQDETGKISGSQKGGLSASKDKVVKKTTDFLPAFDLLMCDSFKGKPPNMIFPGLPKAIKDFLEVTPNLYTLVDASCLQNSPFIRNLLWVTIVPNRCADFLYVCVSKSIQELASLKMSLGINRNVEYVYAPTPDEQLEVLTDLVEDRTTSKRKVDDASGGIKEHMELVVVPPVNGTVQEIESWLSSAKRAGFHWVLSPHKYNGNQYSFDEIHSIKLS